MSTQVKVPWLVDSSGRRTFREPAIPAGVGSWRIVEDHGDEVTVEITDPNWPPRTSKAVFWSRATDAEAEQIDALLEAQPARMRRLWQDALYLDHTHEMFSAIRTGLVDLFGEARADDLLAEGRE